MTKKTPLLSAPTGVTAEEKGASLKLKGQILSEINGAIMPQASFWKAATVSGETTRTPRHLGSQTAFDFEILCALWLTHKRDLLAKRAIFSAGAFLRGATSPG